MNARFRKQRIKRQINKEQLFFHADKKFKKS